MSSNTGTKLGSLALAIMLVCSVFAGAVVGPVAAAGNADHDNEASATSATSDILAGTTVGNVDGSADNYTEVHTISDTNDTEYVLEDADGGYAVYENSSLNFEGSNATHQFQSANISHDELLDLEHAPGENVTVESTVYNTTNVSRSDAVSDNVTAYIEWTNDTATETITDSEVEDGDLVEVTTEDASTFAGFDIPLTSGADKSRIEAEDTEIPNQSVYIAAANGSVADDFSTTLDEFDSEGTMSSVLALRGPNALVKVSSDDTTMFVPVYAESAPDSVDDDDTYAVVKSVGGTDMIVLQNLDEVDGWDTGDEVDVTAATGTGTDGFFVGYLTQSIGLDSILSTVSGFGGLTGAGFGGVVSLGVGAAVVRRRMEA